MSEKILIIVAVEGDGEASKQDLEVVGLAKKIRDASSGSLDIGIIGGNTASAVEQLKAMGARAVYTVSGDAYSTSRYKSDATAVQAVATASEATVILGAASPRWSRMTAGVTQRLGGVFDANITAATFEGTSLAVDRWFYRQRMKGVITREKRPWVLTISPGSAEPAQPSGEASEIIALSPESPVSRTTVKGIKASQGNAQTIKPEAEVLLVAGAGWTKKQADGAVHANEAEALILGFLDKADASLGSSKSLVDLGSEGQEVLPFLTHLHQIGQTGATPRHPKGLSTCCHGEEPHAVGWRFINERRAISLDANCGWAHGKADVLYVADAFEVMEKVNALL